MIYNITPEQFLNEVGASFVRRVRWLSLKICPFCYGGSSGEKYSFSVHIQDGNFFCHRNKCGERGNFWKLIEFYGRNPRDYRGESDFKPKKKKKKYMYGSEN
ncbi:MAG: hypothetical protein ABWZ66_09560 [Pyrinomonadaceae bacterium]